jgi:hypothetical protein
VREDGPEEAVADRAADPAPGDAVSLFPLGGGY